MNISHVAASRSRSVESRAFSSEDVSHKTENERSTDPPVSPLAWIRPFRTRLLDGETKHGKSETWVLVKLLEHVDRDGRAWVSIETIAKGARLTPQTARKALHTLEKTGWLLINPHSWTTLTKEQAALGRKPPRRGDVGQATNVYVILDGNGNLACNQTRPGLARVEPLIASPANSPTTPSQKQEGGPSQKQEGGPLSKLIGDLAPSEDRSMKVSVERVPSIDTSTHNFTKSPKTEDGNLEAWNVIVEVHAEKTKAVHGLPPLPPDLKREQRQALADLLDGAVLEVRATVRERTGIEREFGEVRRELIKRAMNLYFKADTPHLRRVKHALRDLPRDFHACLSEARQTFLRECHDAAQPRRTPLGNPHERVVSVDKPAEITPQERHKEPELAPVDKPREAASSNTAVEARRLLEVLSAQLQPSETSKFERPKIPAISRPIVTDTDTQRADKPVQDKPVQDKQSSSDTISFEQKRFEDKPAQDKPASRFDRPLGRTGAPRWGSIGPRPTKVRDVKKLTTEEAASNEKHGGDSTSTR